MMCIITFAYKVVENQPFIVVANRDEFYERPAKEAAFWEDEPNIFGGRDLEKMGGWLAVQENGRFAAVTNYRDFSMNPVGEKSRGEIVKNFVAGTEYPEAFLEAIQQERTRYGAMNVLVYDGETFMHYNNIENVLHTIEPGIHCVSNATLNTPWPKLERMKMLVAHQLEQQATTEELAQIGLDDIKPNDERLPNTGAGLLLERDLSSIFVKREGYGTRCTTVLRLMEDKIEFFEQTYEQGIATTCVHEWIKLRVNA